MLQQKESDVILEKEPKDSIRSNRELSCNRLKKTAVTAALDIRLARMFRSPERCARSLMELGLSAFPDKLGKDEQLILLQKLLTACRNRDIIKAREMFFTSFLA